MHPQSKTINKIHQLAKIGQNSTVTLARFRYCYCHGVMDSGIDGPIDIGIWAIPGGNLNASDGTNLM